MKNSVSAESVRGEGGRNGACKIRPALGMAKGNGEGGTGERCVRV